MRKITSFLIMYITTIKFCVLIFLEINNYLCKEINYGCILKISQQKEDLLVRILSR